MTSFATIWIFLILSASGPGSPLVPPSIGFLINNGEKNTNNHEISVRIRSLKNPPHLIDSMQIGVREDLSDAAWLPFSSEAVSLTLPPGDGEKKVYARLKDKAGNISAIESAAILVDTKPPADMELFINKGAAYTNDRTGKVFLQTKGEDAVAWQLSNTENFDNAQWEKINQNKSWILDLRGGDGERNVYARFKDAAGNISAVQFKTIIYDTESPKNGQITINTGEKYTRSTKVRLKIKAEGAHVVRIADRVTAQNYNYEPGNEEFMIIDWKFDSLQGKKFVRAFFMDAAGNRTTTPAEAEIIYDTEGPAMPRIVIDNGREFTNNAEGKVSLQIFLRENEPNLKMVISDNELFKNADVQNFSPTVKEFTLPEENDGLKTIYLKLFDEAGNGSSIASASISLDRTPPIIHSFKINEGKEFVISPQISIETEAEDAIAMQFSNSSSFSAAAKWEPFKPFINDWKLLPGDGKKTVFARFRDNAGNISPIYSAAVILDTQPPSGSFVINNGQKFTNHPEGKVNLAIDYKEDDVMGMQISSTPDFTQAKLLPVKPTLEEWPLSDSDGTKTVFLRLKDKAGNFSTVYTSNIILDRKGPENGEIKINNGEPWLTNPSKKVALSLIATDAYKVKLSETPDFTVAEWMPYRTSLGWTLSGDEGEHAVYAIFADQAGNVSPVTRAQIRSDFTPPVVKQFSVEGSKTHCNDPQKKIRLAIEVEGASEMAIDNIPIGSQAVWEPVKTSKEWILSNEDGLKTVYARFRDPAGNMSAEQSIKILLDRVPPVENEIFINRNDEWFTQKDGMAKLYIRSNGASETRLGNLANLEGAAWEPFSAIKENWRIDVGKTEATVYAQFRDAAGNTSEIISDKIKIDISAPQHPKIIINQGEKFVKDSEQKLSVAIAVEGARFMKLGFDKTLNDVEWEPTANQKTLIASEGDGNKVVYAQFKDHAGNLSEIVHDDIVLDTTPPKLISFQIDSGAEWTNNSEKKVALYIQAEEASEMRLGLDETFTNTHWQKFKEVIENFELPGEDGEKSLFLMLRDEAGNVSATHSAKITLKRNF